MLWQNRTVLTNDQLAAYDTEVARLLNEGRVIAVIGVPDLAAIISELTMLRL